MENATKALLIAAAVLVAILVISLGIIIYQRASETVTGAGDLSEYQIQQVNEKYMLIDMKVKILQHCILQKLQQEKSKAQSLILKLDSVIVIPLT